MKNATNLLQRLYIISWDFRFKIIIYPYRFSCHLTASLELWVGQSVRLSHLWRITAVYHNSSESTGWIQKILLSVSSPVNVELHLTCGFDLDPSLARIHEYWKHTIFSRISERGVSITCPRNTLPKTSRILISKRQIVLVTLDGVVDGRSQSCLATY